MKNFTQLLPGRDGSKAKTNNTSGHAHAFTLILTLLLTLGAGQMWGADYYYHGTDNSWGTGIKMTPSDDGFYHYYSVTEGMTSANNFKITSASGWGTEYTGVNKGFNSTDIIGDSGDGSMGGGNGSNIWLYNTTACYILIYPSGTAINSTGSPIICASTYLPSGVPHFVAGTPAAMITNGTEWGTTDPDNQMTYNTSTSIYSKTTASLTAGTLYSFKVSTYNWGSSWNTAGTCHNLADSYPTISGDNLTFKTKHNGVVIISFNSSNKILIDAPYQVSYAAGTGASGTVSASAITTYGSTCTLSSSTFNKTGYTQDGWATSNGGAKVYNLGATYTGGHEDVTLYPHWAANSYDITYKDEGNVAFSGTHGDGYPTKHTYGTATALVSPTKDGYSFVGWYTTSTCTGDPVTSLSATGYTANITLYAKWSASPGVSLSASKATINIGETITLTATGANASNITKYEFYEGSTKINTATTSSTSATYSYKPTTMGNKTLKVVMTYNSGSNTVTSSNVVISFNTPSVATLTEAGSTTDMWIGVNPTSALTFNATSSNVNSGASVTWAISDASSGTFTQTGAGSYSGKSWTYTPASTGAKTITVTMTVGGQNYTKTYSLTVYERWNIYVQNNCSWAGGVALYMWNGSGSNAGWPGVQGTGTGCELYSGKWYKVTLDSQYDSFILNKNANGEQSSDCTIGSSSGTYEADTYWYFEYDHEWDGTKYYNLTKNTSLADPTVWLDAGGSSVVNTNQLFFTGHISNYGGDGSAAADMLEVGFELNGVQYPVDCKTGDDPAYFWGYVTGLTAGTTYTVKAYATNIHGTGKSSGASYTTRASGTTTIKVRTAVGRGAPYIHAFTETDDDCNGTMTENASYPGVSMGDAIITGTVYKWYSYNLSNEYNNFIISEGGTASAANAVRTNTFDNPLETTCYWYHPTEATQGDRMGSMSCPSFDPQLMIDDGGGMSFSYFDMEDGAAANTVEYTASLSANTTYKFKPVYNAEWYGKASTTLTRAANSANSLSASDEANLQITTDVAGDYTFVFNTSTKALRVEFPTAYTVTFGYGTGGSAVTASATTAGGALTSGDYVAAGDEVTFTQTPVTGYTFKGWYTTADGNTTVGTMGVSDNELNDIAADATVYAQYTPNNYTVTFDAATNGGICGTPSKSVTFDAAYGDLPEATKAAKVFAGWYTTASGAGTQVTAETIVSTANDHTLYARFEDTYSVTIQYKSGDVTLKPNSSTTASATALAPEITAPEFLGYTFTGWTGTSATFADESSATTTVNVTAATTITANYSTIPTVYFKNNLGWEHVYVTFDAYFGEAGGATVPGQNGKPYYEMTQMGKSDIFSCVIPAAIVSSWKTNIAFDNKGYASTDNVGTYGLFYQGEFIGRGDFASEATMFIPYNGDKEGRNGGTYYRTGCWMKYNSTDPGYKVYANTYKEGSGGSAVAGTPVLLIADIAGGYEFKATVNFPSANYTYGFMLKKEATSNTNDLWYTNTSDIYASTTTLPWDFTAAGASENGTRCGLHTEATGNYEITVSFATGKPMVNVTYPVSTNDWRLVYKDRATWSNGAHTAAWQHPSRVIKAKADAEDIVSFYVSKAVGANATIELQKCTAIDPGTGAQTWTKQSDVDLSGITGTGIYNFKVTQDGEGDATAAYDGSYSGNFYIRTDASDGGWSNYKTSGTNTMTYSEYAEKKSGFTHYFMRYVTTGTNIKFCIANDYSECISDTLVGDSYTGEYIAVYGNVRFMWDHRTNKVSRAYISGSSNVSDRFLVLEGDDKMFNEAGTALTTAAGGKVEYLNEYEMKFTDDQNWIYEATVHAKPGARIKLTAKYNNKIQYFYGAAGDRSAETTEQLLGGEGSTQYKIRIVYDFKTNRLIKAFIPESAIENNLSIEADLMIIREHQDNAQQITFNGGSLKDVKTVYGAMKFNKYTVNGKEKTGGHALTDDSRYKRDLFYISFPFDVKLSDVFGFGTYGKHWIIEYYDGKGRAKNGFWADSDSYWKFVLPSQRSSFTLKAFEGYILALDLDEMTEGSSIWNNGVEDVYVYFPSSAAVEDIQATNRLITIDQEGYQCQIGPRFEGGEDRRVKDSYWHVIGVPSFANYNNPLTETDGGTAIDWSDDDGTIDWSTPSLPYLYEWNSTDNSLSVTRSATFSFKATYSYMVQYAGASIYWSAVNATPSSVVARKNDNQPTSAEFRLELQQTGKAIDQTFVRLTDEVNVTTGFDFNYDLSKEMNANKANIFTMITTAMDDGNTVTESAANCLPMSGQTTVVPVGVKIAANDDYTFSIPDGANGVGVTLIDNLTGTRTNLSAVDYTVSLEAGTYDERFTLEISPIQYLPTELEQSDINNQMSDVRKVLIDGLLYIVHDNKMYDARGARVE